MGRRAVYLGIVVVLVLVGLGVGLLLGWRTKGRACGEGAAVITFSGPVKSMASGLWRIGDYEVGISSCTAIGGSPLVGSQVAVKALRQRDGALVARVVEIAPAPCAGASSQPFTFVGSVRYMGEKQWLVGQQVVTIDDKVSVVGKPAPGSGVIVRAISQPDCSVKALAVEAVGKALEEPGTAGCQAALAQVSPCLQGVSVQPFLIPCAPVATPAAVAAPPQPKAPSCLVADEAGIETVVTRLLDVAVKLGPGEPVPIVWVVEGGQVITGEPLTVVQKLAIAVTGAVTPTTPITGTTICSPNKVAQAIAGNFGISIGTLLGYCEQIPSYGTLTQLLWAAQQTGKSMEELVSWFVNQGLDVGAIYQQLGLKPGSGLKPGDIIKEEKKVTPEAKGKPEEKGKPAEPKATPEAKGKPEEKATPEAKGKPAEPKVTPEAKGKPEEKATPEAKGKPAEPQPTPETKGKPEEKGKPAEPQPTPQDKGSGKK